MTEERETDGASRWSVSPDLRHAEPFPHHERRLEHLIDRLPNRLRMATRWLRRPSSRWARVPAGMLLISGGLLSILPFLGLWMLPLGVMLLAEDVPPLRRARDRLLDRIERHRPHWFVRTETVMVVPLALPASQSNPGRPGETR